MWPHSPDIYNCMHPSQKPHDKKQKALLSKHLQIKNKEIFSREICYQSFACASVKTKKYHICFQLFLLNWGFSLYMIKTHQHLLALTVECPLWRRSDGLEQTGSYHSMLRVPSLSPRCTCGAQRKTQTFFSYSFMIHSESNWIHFSCTKNTVSLYK